MSTHLTPSRRQITRHGRATQLRQLCKLKLAAGVCIVSTEVDLILVWIEVRLVGIWAPCMGTSLSMGIQESALFEPLMPKYYLEYYLENQHRQTGRPAHRYDSFSSAIERYIARGVSMSIARLRCLKRWAGLPQLGSTDD